MIFCEYLITPKGKYCLTYGRPDFVVVIDDTEVWFFKSQHNREPTRQSIPIRQQGSSIACFFLRRYPPGQNLSDTLL